MTTPIDPVQFGKLINAVETLKADVEVLTKTVTGMREEMSRGKGMFAGALLMAGGLGAGAGKFVEWILHR